MAATIVEKTAAEVAAGDTVLHPGTKERWSVGRVGWHGNGKRSLTLNRGTVRTVLAVDPADPIEVEREEEEAGCQQAKR